MSMYLDDDGANARIIDLETMVERFIELFDESDGVPYLNVDEDELVDILNEASVLLETTYSEIDS